ncbi:hypothetical protein KHQ81_05195 [Mycoplasmatota bacterium]|nr:hypothetical protein KHQ81_05195 [Mycoplasmatota bacterium]
MISLIENYKVISIIGMAKNVGKTTTLNYLLKHLYHKKVVGLTSIGRDGENVDVVTNTPKPKIYIESGTIIATTTICLQNSDFTKQILETTDINTPLGEVVIVRALSDGYVDLAGPSFNQQMKRVISRLKHYSVDVILIDGAISRKGLASEEVSEATILCTGAAYSSQIKTVIEDTEHIVHLFNLKEVDQSLYTDFSRVMDESPLSLVYQNGFIKSIKVKTALNSAKQIINELNYGVKYLLINGALTDEFLKVLFENRNKFKSLKVVVPHATKCLFHKYTSDKLKHINVDIQVLEKTKLLCVSINPTSPLNYAFDAEKFQLALSQKLTIPIYNVVRDNDE